MPTSSHPNPVAINDSRPKRRILVVLFFGVLMAALDIAIVGPALPALREHYALSERSVAWVFNIFVLFNLLGLPLMARLSDVVGRRRTYTLDVALFAVGSLIVAAAPPYWILLIGRGMQGVAASGIFPVASAVVGDVIAPERRGRALGVLGAVFGIAFIIGPMLAGILLLFGWQWLFLINVPLAGFVGISAIRILPSGTTAGGRRIDWPGILSLGATLSLFAYGINQIETGAFWMSVFSMEVLPFILAAACLLPVFVVVERRAYDPLIRLSLFGRRQVRIAAALGVGAGLTEAAFVFMPAMAGEAFGASQSDASFMLLPLVAAVAIGSPVAGRLLDRVGTRMVILFSTFLLSVGLGSMGLGPLTTTSFYVASVLIGLGLSGLLGSSLSYILLEEATKEERTVAQGIGTLAISIGQLCGGALIGALVAGAVVETAGYRAAFTFVAAVAGLLFAVSFYLKPRSAQPAR